MCRLQVINKICNSEVVRELWREKCLLLTYTQCLAGNRAPRNIHLTSPLYRIPHPGAKRTDEFLAPRNYNLGSPQKQKQHHKRWQSLGHATLQVEHASLSWSGDLPIDKVLTFGVPIGQHSPPFIIRPVFTTAVDDSHLFTRQPKDYLQVNLKEEHSSLKVVYIYKFIPTVLTKIVKAGRERGSNPLTCQMRKPRLRITLAVFGRSWNTTPGKLQIQGSFWTNTIR